MATKLNITQALYARYESEAINVSVDKLQQIAEILETDISSFFNSVKLTIETQTNNEGSYGNGYVENINVENKEIYKKLIENLETENKHLQEEIMFLREILNKN